MVFVKTLKSVQRADEPLVGERAVDLTVLREKGYDVPLGFVVTNEAFEAFITHNTLRVKISDALSGGEKPVKIYDHIRELLLEGTFPDELMRLVVDGYESLSVNPEGNADELIASDEAPFVTVLLSPTYAVPEESTEGVILNVNGLEELALAIKESWACLFTPTMQSYREKAGLGYANVNAGVIVERAPKNGVSVEAWSARKGKTEELCVKAYYGSLDIGVGVEKDEWRLTREYLKPVYQSVAIQTVELARDEEGRLGKVPIGARGEEQKLTDRLFIEVGRLAKKASIVLEKHVKIYGNVLGEDVILLCCDRLHLTEGSVKLDAYQAEERLDESTTEVAEVVEALEEDIKAREESLDAPRTNALVAEATPEPVVEAASEAAPVVVAEAELGPKPEAEVLEEALVAKDVPSEEATPLQDDPAVEVPETPTSLVDEDVAEELEEPIPETEEETVAAEAETSQEEPAGDSIFAGVSMDEKAPVAERVGEEPTPEPELVEGASEEKPVAEEGRVVEEAEPEREPEAVSQEAEPEAVQEEPVVEAPVVEEEPVEEDLTLEEPVEATPAEDPVAEEVNEEEAEEAPKEDESVNRDEPETDDEERVVDEEATEEESRSYENLDDAYDAVVEALRKRWEGRFKGVAPADAKTLFFDLSSEVIIPHEEEIGTLIRLHDDEEGYDQEVEERILSIIDDFLREIK